MAGWLEEEWKVCVRAGHAETRRRHSGHSGAAATATAASFDPVGPSGSGLFGPAHLKQVADRLGWCQQSSWVSRRLSRALGRPRGLPKAQDAQPATRSGTCVA